MSVCYSRPFYKSLWNSSSFLSQIYSLQENFQIRLVRAKKLILITRYIIFRNPSQKISQQQTVRTTFHASWAPDDHNRGSDVQRAANAERWKASSASHRKGTRTTAEAAAAAAADEQCGQRRRRRRRRQELLQHGGHPGAGMRHRVAAGAAAHPAAAAAAADAAAAAAGVLAGAPGGAGLHAHWHEDHGLFLLVSRQWEYVQAILFFFDYFLCVLVFVCDFVWHINKCTRKGENFELFMEARWPVFAFDWIQLYFQNCERLRAYLARLQL